MAAMAETTQAAAGHLIWARRGGASPREEPNQGSIQLSEAGEAI